MSTADTTPPSPASSIEEAIARFLEAELEAMDRADTPPALTRIPRATQPPAPNASDPSGLKEPS